MRALIPLLLILVAACGAPTASSEAHEMSAGASVAAIDAWAAPTPAGVDVAAGYMTITNSAGAADHLLSATSQRAQRVEVHEMSMDGGVMRMRQLERLEIPAHGEMQLRPGGNHLMFFGIHEPFEQGQEIPVRLVFEHAGAIDVTLPVRRTAPADHNGH
ncbi:MAG: copper chaperone PCu(A)C [Hyphomonadaceae bacterium]